MRVVKYFVAGVRESRWDRPYSGATEEKLMDAYWAGNRFAWKIPRGIRAVLAKRSCEGRPALIHPRRRRATYPAVSRSVAPFWVGLSVSTVLYLFIIGMSIQKGLSL